MERDERIGTVKALIKSLEKHIEYADFENNYQNIKSYKDYIFSRFLDKLSTLAINYVRLSWITDKISFAQTKDISSDKERNRKYNKESDIELAATILRPLLELFLELKSIDLTVTKFEGTDLADIEPVSQLIYYEYNTTFNELKLTVCKEFYDCEPKYLKLWSEINKKEVNRYKQKFSQMGIPLLKNTKNKLLDIVKNNKKREIILLGYDYLTLYAFLSKKSHFSYSNIVSDNFSNDMLMNWSLFYFLAIYLQIMDYLKAEDDMSKYLEPIMNSLDMKTEDKEFNKIKIGKIVIFDFGIAKVMDKKGLKLKVKYLASNAFDVGTVDEIPKVFVKKELNESDFTEVHNKYYKEPRIKYDDEGYIDFYLELMSLTNDKLNEQTKP